ncbi:hypothetical protein FE783_27780 [Paenibacillus mesophilus]|uniref:hypothetical protein n=1 Tax=Paenibacillus mesophilus TaxID=2582849 RepID=UPI00110E56C4|nr:hypothetical protein [Paenibacillus mesophilus]TMV45943.1 hypothetical protein FE783_27780 [Paenibacillus mesophilus]
MIVRPTVRTIGLLSVAFALLWSFLMPTADTVVTPISQSIPAVSAPASIHSPLGAPAHFLQKLRVFLPLITIFLPLCTIVLRDICIRARLERFAPPVPLLRKQLLLRPLKFTSMYVGA